MTDEQERELAKNALRSVRTPKHLAGLEHIAFLQLVRSNGIADPTPEFQFAAPERKFALDYAWPDVKVGVECEGGVWTKGAHGRGSGIMRDMEKSNLWTVMGWRVLRLTPSQLVQPDSLAMLAQLLETQWHTLSSRPAPRSSSISTKEPPMSDTLSVPPAMTAEEWTSAYIGKDVDIYQKSRGLDGSRRLEVNVRGHPLGGSMGDQRDLHALAALCLYQQPFGFSQADVELLRLGEVSGGLIDAGDVSGLDRLHSLVSRISSLLPPETP